MILRSKMKRKMVVVDSINRDSTTIKKMPLKRKQKAA